LEEAVKSGKAECMFKLKNIELKTVDIGNIINDINRDSDYILAAFSYSYSPESQVISFMMEYK
jgi:soluble P-type ATPase